MRKTIAPFRELILGFLVCCCRLSYHSLLEFRNADFRRLIMCQGTILQGTEYHVVKLAVSDKIVFRYHGMPHGTPILHTRKQEAAFTCLFSIGGVEAH
jgi:hypothetical protein